MTRQEMLDSARQALAFEQGSMVIPLNHVEKFLAAQSDELEKVRAEMKSLVMLLAELT